MKKKFYPSILLLLCLLLMLTLGACREPSPPPPETGDELKASCFNCKGYPAMRHHAAVAPTCTTTGYAEHWTCDTCNIICVNFEGTRYRGTADEMEAYAVVSAVPHEPYFSVTETTHSAVKYQCGCPFEGDSIENAPHVLDAHGWCEICSYQQGSPEVIYQINKSEGWAMATGFSDVTLPSELRIASHYQGYEVVLISLYPHSSASAFGSQNDKDADWRVQNVKTVVIPHTVLNIAFRSFANFSALSEVVFAPNARLMRLGGECFANCTALTSVTIPKSVRWIEDELYGGGRSEGCCPEMPYASSDAFYGCTALSQIVFPADSSLSVLHISACPALRELRLPASGALRELYLNGFSALEELTLPAGIRRLAVENCDGLTALSLPQAVQYLSLRGCSALRSLTLPEGLKNIEEKAFADCEALEFIHIPESVKTVGKNAFLNCNALTSFEISRHLYENAAGLFAGCGGLVEVTVPAGVTRLAEELFLDCARLRHVELPEGLTQIGDGTFAGCGALASVNFPAGLLSVGARAFDGAALEAVCLPEGLVALYPYAFADCDRLVSVTLPDTLTGIGEYAFSHCDALADVELPEQLIEVGRGAFSDCVSLESLYFYGNIARIQSFAFRGCTALNWVGFICADVNFSVECEESKASVYVGVPEKNAEYLRGVYHSYSWVRIS